MAVASFRCLLQLHKDVPKAAGFTPKGWTSPSMSALFDGGSSSPAHLGFPSCNSPMPNINQTVMIALGDELDGPIKYEVHGKVAAMQCIDGHMLGLREPA